MGLCNSRNNIVYIDNMQPICDLKYKSLDILFVSTNNDLAEGKKTMLEKYGHRVTITTNGEDCIKLIKQKWIERFSVYNVIIMDLNYQRNVFRDDIYYAHIIKNELEKKLVSKGITLPFIYNIALNDSNKFMTDDFDASLKSSFTVNEFYLTLKKSTNVQDLIYHKPIAFKWPPFLK